MTSDARVRRGTEPRRTQRHVIRWLEADPRDVVALRPARRTSTHPANAAPRIEAAAGANIALADGSLVGGLRRWRGRIARHRALALVRRALLVAAPVAVVLVAIGRDGALPVVVMIAAPVGVALVAGAVAARRRRLDLAGVAHLLDDRLALAEVVGTGLELETTPRRAENRLDARVRASASATVGETLGGWRAVARRAPREWAVLVVAAGAVAVLALTGSTSGGGGGMLAARSGHGASGSGSGSRPSGAARRAGKRGAGNHAPALGSPTGRPYDPYANRHQTAYLRALNRRLAAQPQLSYTAPGIRPDLASAGAPTGRSTRSGSPAAGANTSPPSASTAPSPGSATQSPPSSGVAPVGSPSAAAGGGGGGSASGGQQQHSAAPSGAPGSPSSRGSAGGAAQSGQSGQAGAHGGAPTGGTEAGHTRGTTQSGRTAPAQLSAGPQGLPLQGGYVPGKPGGRAQAGNTGGGGGGRSRDRGISGGVASSPNGGAFPYIPPDVAAIPGSQQGLLTDYLDVLRSLSGEIVVAVAAPAARFSP